MTYAPVTYDGGAGVYAVPFPYLDKAHVNFLDVNGDPYSGSLTWLTASTVSLAPDVSGVDALTISRTTPTDPVVTYSSGPIASVDLNHDALQALYLIEEFDDRNARAVTVPHGEIGHNLPPLADRMNKAAGWDNSGKFIVAASAIPQAIVSGYMDTLLTAASQTALRTLLGVYDPPTESMTLNGEVLFDQVNEGGQYTSNSVEKYGPDQWRFAGVGTGSWNFRRTSNIFPGFSKALQATVVTPQASLLSTDNHHIEHAIEGYRIRKLKWGTAAAVPLTLQFWVNTTVPGDYSLAILNGTNTVYYLTTYNVPSTGNHLITVTIPPCTIGTWVDTSLFGLKFIWDMGWGSAFESSTTEAWTTGSGFRKPGTVALIKNSGAVFYMGGIQDDIGLQALPFRYKSFSSQLLDLQRYFWKSFDQGVACATGAGKLSAGEAVYAAQIANTAAGYVLPVRNPVVMTDFTRTVTTYNPVSANAKWRNESLDTDSGVPTIFGAGADGFNILNPQVSGDTAASLLGIHFSVNARLGGF